MADSATQQDKIAQFARVGGQSITTFEWDGTIIAFARQVRVQSPQPVGQTTPIHPLDARRPKELITPFAISMGTLEIEIYELFGSKIWQQLSAQYLTGNDIVDLADIYDAVAQRAVTNPLTVNKVITPVGNRGPKSRTETYHGVVISSVLDDETIEIGTMEVTKRLVVNYRYSTIANG